MILLFDMDNIEPNTNPSENANPNNESGFIPNYQPSALSSNDIYSKPGLEDDPIKLLVIALALDVVGFGSCTVAHEVSNSLIIIPILVYLLAFYVAFKALIRIHKRFKYLLTMIFMWILTIIIGGWGLVWGVDGIGFLFGF